MAEFYCFGRFALDPAERRLYEDGVPVSLGRTDLGLLSALVGSAGALVAKEDLVSRVWRRAAVSDDVIYAHIKTLRKLVGHDCIVNKQGRGYRFLAQVQRARKPPQPDKPQPGNLPSLWTGGAADGLRRLIGRSEQLRIVPKLLTRSRLVTLTGPGGVGKTKLALHAAPKRKTHFPDGIWLVELAGLKDADLVSGAAAAALGIEIGDNAKPLDTLARHLARRSLLIVLDNCEHVIAGAANLCEALLGAAPGVTILATSREALGCSGEQVFEVPPLALPREDVTAPAIIRRTAAVELFVQRALNADANFQMADADAPIAARICRRVDGLPLAIEMAAGWAGVLGLETLDAKLEGSIKGWLRAGTAAPQRHSTLRGTFEWSHDLLSEAERVVLRRLAVFAGSFDLQAAEAVAGADAVPDGQTFEHVASLIRKSMVAVVPGPQAQGYRLLETTRGFMLEKLAVSGDAKETRQRHAHYVLRVLENAMSELETTSDSVWRGRYGPVIEDLRVALDWTMGVESDDAVALAGASWPLWRQLPLRTEGRQRLSAAASRIHSDIPPKLEARLRLGIGDLCVSSAAAKAAAGELGRAVLLYRGLGDRPRLGSALTHLAYTLLMMGRVTEAEQAIVEALKLLEPVHCPRMVATAYSTQSCIEARLGRFANAFAAGQKAASLCELAGADRTALATAANLIEITLEKGDVDSAISAGRTLMARLRDPSHSHHHGYLLGVLTGALTARGDLHEALAAAREAAPLLRDDDWLFWLFDHLALRCGLVGRVTDAALLAGYADAAYRNIDCPREPMGRRAVARLDVLLRDALPNREIARLARMGARLSEDQALTLALNA